MKFRTVILIIVLCAVGIVAAAPIHWRSADPLGLFIADPLQDLTMLRTRYHVSVATWRKVETGEKISGESNVVVWNVSKRKIVGELHYSEAVLMDPNFLRRKASELGTTQSDLQFYFAEEVEVNRLAPTFHGTVQVQERPNWGLVELFRGLRAAAVVVRNGRVIDIHEYTYQW